MATIVPLSALIAELERQIARYAFRPDPILQASIADLMEMLQGYPHKLIWAAEQPPEESAPGRV